MDTSMRLSKLDDDRFSIVATRGGAPGGTLCVVDQNLPVDRALISGRPLTKDFGSGKEVLAVRHEKGGGLRAYNATVHPDVFLPEDSQVGEYCIVPFGAKIGKGVKVMYAASLGINVNLHDDVVVGVGAVLENGVTAREGVRVKDGAVVRTGITLDTGRIVPEGTIVSDLHHRPLRAVAGKESQRAYLPSKPTGSVK